MVADVVSNTDTDIIPVGTRVGIHFVILQADERAAGLPADTASRQYEGRSRGILLTPAKLGEYVSISTPAGRELGGTLEAIEPADTHTFGKQPPEMVEAIQAIQAITSDLGRKGPVKK